MILLSLQLADRRTAQRGTPPCYLGVMQGDARKVLAGLIGIYLRSLGSASEGACVALQRLMLMFHWSDEVLFFLKR